jgi:3D (Asp-Asp-Asp) domain-containing protein
MKTSNSLVCLLIAIGIFSLTTLCLGIKSESVDENKNNNNINTCSTSIFHSLSQKEENALLTSNKAFFQEEEEESKKIKVIITAYSSEESQTDNTPLVTANGTLVKDGIVANNLLPFGTEIKIPELYGDKIFTVADRMHSRKGNYKVDIWFPTKEEAINFGVKEAYIEVSQL